MVEPHHTVPHLSQCLGIVFKGVGLHPRLEPKSLLISLSHLLGFTTISDTLAEFRAQLRALDDRSHFALPTSASCTAIRLREVAEEAADARQMAAGLFGCDGTSP